QVGGLDRVLERRQRERAVAADVVDREVEFPRPRGAAPVVAREEDGLAVGAFRLGRVLAELVAKRRAARAVDRLAVGLQPAADAERGRLDRRDEPDEAQAARAVHHLGGGEPDQANRAVILQQFLRLRLGFLLEILVGGAALVLFRVARKIPVVRRAARFVPVL